MDIGKNNNTQASDIGQTRNIIIPVHGLNMKTGNRDHIRAQCRQQNIKYKYID